MSEHVLFRFRGGIASRNASTIPPIQNQRLSLKCWSGFVDFALRSLCLNRRGKGEEKHVNKTATPTAVVPNAFPSSGTVTLGDDLDAYSIE